MGWKGVELGTGEWGQENGNREMGKVAKVTKNTSHDDTMTQMVQMTL